MTHPHWQPLSMLPTVHDAAQGMLETAQMQMQSLRAALRRPETINEKTVIQVSTAYCDQKPLLSVYLEQYERWQHEISDQQEQLLAAELRVYILELLQINKNIMDLTNKLLAKKTVASNSTQYTSNRKIAIP